MSGVVVVLVPCIDGIVRAYELDVGAKDQFVECQASAHLPELHQIDCKYVPRSLYSFADVMLPSDAMR